MKDAEDDPMEGVTGGGRPEGGSHWRGRPRGGSHWRRTTQGRESLAEDDPGEGVTSEHWTVTVVTPPVRHWVSAPGGGGDLRQVQ